jgi:3-hydroxypropanoate dehydrogenase
MLKLNEQALDLIFRTARTPRTFLPKSVAVQQLREIYDVAKLAPTSFNCCPLRIVFILSMAGKERLRPALAKGNIEKTMTAPVTAIFAHDLRFYEHLPRLFPYADARSRFEQNPDSALASCNRNGTLQAAYFILAARTVGLDAGPMSGFDNAQVDAEFFPSGRWRSNFLCNIGYGDRATLLPRGPRLEFEETCTIL